MIVSIITVRRIAPDVAQMVAVERDDAIQAYQSGGPAQLKAYLDRLHGYDPVEHFLTDSTGRDLVDGENRSSLLKRGARKFNTRREIVIVSRSSGRPYSFVVLLTPPSIWTYVSFYLLVPLVVCLLGWILAVNIASPLRKMSRIVERFGRGERAIRMNFARKDEIGGVARAFDEMADRIETLLAAERRLLQDISHELRSPLTRIGFAAVLLKTAEDREAAAQRLTKEISRFSELVNGLLQVTRVEGDPSTHSSQEVSLPQLLEHVMEDCEVEAEVHGCRLELRVRSNEHLYGDYELLRRAVENVVRNAISYSPRGASIEIALETVNAVTGISVRDYGPGVPEEALLQLFRPFYRVDPVRDSATGGVGLGLAIAQRAIAVHGGSISARNAHPGLLVVVELPLVQGEVQGKAQGDVQGKAQDKEPRDDREPSDHTYA